MACGLCDDLWGVVKSNLHWREACSVMPRVCRQFRYLHSTGIFRAPFPLHLLDEAGLLAMGKLCRRTAVAKDLKVYYGMSIMALRHDGANLPGWDAMGPVEQRKVERMMARYSALQVRASPPPPPLTPTDPCHAAWTLCHGWLLRTSRAGCFVVQDDVGRFHPESYLPRGPSRAAAERGCSAGWWSGQCARSAYARPQSC
jgi:hypothetical protein